MTRDSKVPLEAVRLFEAAYEEARLDYVKAQRLIERGDELKAAITNLVHMLTDTQDGVMVSSYPKGYNPRTFGFRPLGQECYNLVHFRLKSFEHELGFISADGDSFVFWK